MFHGSAKPTRCGCREADSDNSSKYSEKARPLYGWILEEILSRGFIQDLSEFSIFVMWVFAMR